MDRRDPLRAPSEAVNFGPPIGVLIIFVHEDAALGQSAVPFNKTVIWGFVVQSGAEHKLICALICLGLPVELEGFLENVGWILWRVSGTEAVPLLCACGGGRCATCRGDRTGGRHWGEMWLRGTLRSIAFLAVLDEL